MAKVAIVSGNPEIEKPSDEIIKKANTVHYISDEQGRVIGLKKPPTIAQYRLVAAVGREYSDNDRYVAMCMPLLYVHTIDGEPVDPLVKHCHVEALISRLSDEGLSAVSEGILKHFGGNTNLEDAKEALKKS